MASHPHRDRDGIHRCVEAITRRVSQPWTLMEICGGQTHAILRHGLDRLLAPAGIALIHGPGCPVCVTPTARIDQAIALARTPGVILCSFGDMLRVPGTGEDLSTARARGARVQVVYSPLDAVRLAQRQPQDQVVFFAVGFETTAPATALAVLQAQALGLANFSLLVAHVRVPPAVEALLATPNHRHPGPACRRPCLRRDGTRRIRALGPALQSAGGGDGLRATGHPAGGVARR